MIRPAPPASMSLKPTLLAATMLAASAAPVSAAGINLLQPTPSSPARVLIDVSLPPWDSDDAAAAHDGDCVAVADPAPRASFGFGRVSWPDARLAWEWDRGSEPSLVYLVCLGRDRAGWSGGATSAMELFAALSWANAPPTSRSGVLASGATTAPARTSFEIGPTPFISWPGGGDIVDDPSTPTGVIASEPVLFDLPMAMPTAGDTVPPRPPQPGGAIGPLEPPTLIIDPGEVSPVPEPATWLLMGTGLAVTWRAWRRHR